MPSSSYLTCNVQVPRRGVVVAGGGDDDVDDPYYDAPQPQTATCCTALQRGVAPDGLAQQRYAPLRTTPAAAADDDDISSCYRDDNDDRHYSSNSRSTKEETTTTTSIIVNSSKQQQQHNTNSGGGRLRPPAVRKCKSTVEDVHVSHLIQGPRLRRSGGMRRDWSFEDVHNAA
ncbi:hypothetical protein BS78_07G019600 [Paspalum vaginatum]|nr:hypothetical protein BS78_07G019600 [Paspalum vaginatum]